MNSLAAFECPYSCCSVEFSPFDEKRLAVATAQYFGVVGNGQVHILELNASNQLIEKKSFLSPEGLYDCSWNEMNQNQLVTASADGSVCLWDLGAPDNLPVARWLQAHASEVSSVDWNFISKDRFLSSGWDGAVKLWSPEHAHQPLPLAAFAAASAMGAPPAPTYNAIWSPHHPEAFASVSGDGFARTWDCRSGGLSGSVAAHGDEALSVDYDKYSDYLLVTGSVDRSIRVWDWRFTSNGPLQVLVGHGYAVKRLKCHPHATRVVGSVSYDMTCCLWDAGPLPNLAPPPPFDAAAANAPSGRPPTSSSPPDHALKQGPGGGGHLGTRRRGSGLGGDLGLEGVVDRGYGQPKDYGGRGLAGGQLVARGDHREFATGLDFSLFTSNLLATCSWDRTVRIWDTPIGHLQ